MAQLAKQNGGWSSNFQKCSIFSLSTNVPKNRNPRGAVAQPPGVTMDGPKVNRNTVRCRGITTVRADRMGTAWFTGGSLSSEGFGCRSTTAGHLRFPFSHDALKIASQSHPDTSCPKIARSPFGFTWQVADCFRPLSDALSLNLTRVQEFDRGCTYPLIVTFPVGLETRMSEQCCIWIQWLVYFYFILCFDKVVGCFKGRSALSILYLNYMLF